MSIDSGGHRRRVLHVTETMASGVGRAIESYATATPQLQHFLLWGAERAGSAQVEDPHGFDELIRLPHGHLHRIAAVRRTVRQLRPDVVHAHSSFAGVYVRLALARKGGDRQRARIVYTPHCFAFARQDISPLKRAAFWTAEALLGLNTDAIAACSPGESRHAARCAPRAARVVVPNVANGIDRRHYSYQRPDGASARVCMAGRVSEQKGWAFFRDTILAMRRHGETVEATWIGDGEQESVRQLTHAEVTVTGWLDRGAAAEELARHDLYLHTAAWEGFPLTLLEATAVGLPSVIRLSPSLRGPAYPLAAQTPEEMARIARDALDGDLEHLHRQWSALLSQNTMQCQSERLLTAYGE